MQNKVSLSKANFYNTRFIIVESYYGLLWSNGKTTPGLVPILWLH